MSGSLDTRPQDAQLATGPVRVVSVASEADRLRWGIGFVGAYQTVFAGAPYLERFTPDEVDGRWRRLTGLPHHLTLVAVTPRDQVVGFAMGLPLRHQRDVCTLLAGLVDVDTTFYFGELGVLPEWRGQGLGRRLMRDRLKRLPRDRFPDVVLRVSASHASDLSLYEAMGFQRMGVHMDVPNLRTDGRVRTDRRIVLHNAASQVRVDDAPAVP
jgi:ribosomal protein S18 acetylase RimI-like enzyme